MLGVANKPSGFISLQRGESCFFYILLEQSLPKCVLFCVAIISQAGAVLGQRLHLTWEGSLLSTNTRTGSELFGLGRDCAHFLSETRMGVVVQSVGVLAPSLRTVRYLCTVRCGVKACRCSKG